MTYDDLIAHYGTPTKAGEAIGIKNPRQTLYGWQQRDKVPLDKQLEYERESAGILRADIPDDTRSVLSGQTA